ncbi:VOC family protein [Dactylosporangium sp. CA-092794]|uniref:VOC family protein n=1 Tax=Dactylosporangium sp. CA-092794 TaxID=3239929 RepID=UPI003D915203
MADRLRDATVEAWRAVERVRGLLDELGEPGVLAVLGERVAALLGELAWELGVIDPAAEAAAGGRLDHVGVVVRDLRAAAGLYGDLLGGALVAGGVHQGLGVRSMHFAYPGGGKVELLQPVQPGPMADFLESRGGGMHHLTFFTADLTTSIEGFDRAGLKVVDVDRSAPEWHEAYLSPRGTQGCVIQVVQSVDLIPVTGMTVASVLADEWQWRDHRPHRITIEARR